MQREALVSKENQITTTENSSKRYPPKEHSQHDVLHLRKTEVCIPAIFHIEPIIITFIIKKNKMFRTDETHNFTV